MAHVRPIPVFFGTERSDIDYKNDCDISQIVMKCGSLAFNKYIDPTKEISKDMAKMNHLEIHNGKIYKDRVLKRSLPLNKVLEQMYQFLQKLNGPCTLIAHKCCFPSAFLLIRAMRDFAMEKKFSSVIAGFTDTFDMFQTKFPYADPKMLNIHTMARDINLRAQQSLKFGRSIKDNVKILEKLALHHFSAEELKAKRSFHLQLRKIESSKMVTPKMPQSVYCPATTNCFVVEKIAAEHPLNENKALKKQAKKGKKKTEKQNDSWKVEEVESSENSGPSCVNVFPEKAAEDLSLMRDREPIVTGRKSGKKRPRKAGKEGKAKKFKKETDSLGEN